MIRSGWLVLCLSCMSQEGFEEDFGESYCTLLSECEVLDFYGFKNMRDCQDTAKATEKNCDFDDDKADECLEGIEQSGCQDLWEQGLPNSCTQVCS